jgi:hypothetical protein
MRFARLPFPAEVNDSTEAMPYACVFLRDAEWHGKSKVNCMQATPNERGKLMPSACYKICQVRTPASPEPQAKTPRGGERRKPRGSCISYLVVFFCKALLSSMMMVKLYFTG